MKNIVVKIVQQNGTMVLFINCQSYANLLCVNSIAKVVFTEHELKNEV